MANESIEMAKIEEVHQQRVDRDYVPNGEVSVSEEDNSSYVGTKDMAEEGHEAMEVDKNATSSIGESKKKQEQGDNNEETTEEESAATTEENVDDEVIVLAKDNGDDEGKQEKVVSSKDDEIVSENAAADINTDEPIDDGQKSSDCEVSVSSKKPDESDVHEISENDKEVDRVENGEKNDDTIKLDDSEANSEDNNEVMTTEDGTLKENDTIKKRKRSSESKIIGSDATPVQKKVKKNTDECTPRRMSMRNLTKETKNYKDDDEDDEPGRHRYLKNSYSYNSCNKKEPHFVIIDINSILSGRKPVSMDEFSGSGSSGNSASSELEIIELDTTPVKEKVKKSTDECTPRGSTRNLNKGTKNYKDEDDELVRYRLSENSYIGENLAEDPLALNIIKQKVKEVTKPALNTNNRSGSKFYYPNSCNKKEPNFAIIDIHSVLSDGRPVSMNDKQAMAGGSVLVPINDHLSRNHVPQQQSHKNKLNQQSILLNPLPGPSATPSTNMTPTKPSDTNPKKNSLLCDICGFHIKDLEQLRIHMRWIHKITLQPKVIYDCKKCLQEYTTVQDLERHLLYSHGLVTSSMQAAANKSKDAVNCQVCGFYHVNLINHLARDHGMTLKPFQFLYKCADCTATFGRFKQFEKHLHLAHSVVAKRAMDKTVPPPAKPAGDSLLKPIKINDQITTISLPAKTSISEEDSPATSRDSAGSSKSL